MAKEYGIGIDCVSAGEISIALKAGFDPHKIYFHGNNKLPSEIEYAITHDVDHFVIDNFHEIDLVEEIIERQLKKYKNKIVDKKQAAVAFSDLFINEEYDSNDEVDIVKVKKFAMKPMDPEEACVQMELLGHSFYVFLNSETEQVNVVYKRKGNTYGLIEPEF